MKKEIRVYDIKWYYNYDPTDETYPKEEYDINFNAEPTEMIVDVTDWDFGEIVDDVDSIDEDLSNYISGESGYYHKGFKWEYVKQKINNMKQLTDNDRKLLCALSDIEMVLDNVELPLPQIEKIWGSFKTIRDVVNEETITGVITIPKSHLEQAIEFATKMCEIKDLIEEDKTILNNPEYISMMKEYNFKKNN